MENFNSKVDIGFTRKKKVRGNKGKWSEWTPNIQVEKGRVIFNEFYFVTKN